MKGDEKIAAAKKSHESGPAQIESLPQILGHGENMAEQTLDEQLATDEVAAEKGRCHDPGDDGRLPFDEGVTVQCQGQPPEDEGEDEGAELCVVEFPAMPVDGGINEDRAEQENARRSIDAEGFESDKKKQQGHKIEKLFHPVSTRRIRWRALVWAL